MSNRERPGDGVPQLADDTSVGRLSGSQRATDSEDAGVEMSIEGLTEPIAVVLCPATAEHPFELIEAGAALDYVRAYCAFEVRLKSQRRYESHVELQLSWLGYLMSLPAELHWSLQLRMEAAPDLRLHLICAAAGPDGTAAYRRLSDVADAVQLSAPILYPVSDLDTVGDEAALNRLLDREIGSAVEIGPRLRPLLPGSEVEAPVRVPVSASTRAVLCQALVKEAHRSGEPAGWTVCVESTLRPLPTSDALMPMVGADREVPVFLPTLDRTLFTDGVANVQAFLYTAGGEVPPSLVAAALAEVGAYQAPGVLLESRRPIRPRELSRSRTAIREARVVRWQQDGSDHPSLAHLADVYQALSFFRLPTPGPRGLPGLPMQATGKEVWLPDAGSRAGIALGNNVYRQHSQPVVLDDDARRRHAWCLGQTGTGKSTLLLNLIEQDMRAGRGLCVLDPHGDLIEMILARVPNERAEDVIVVDPADREVPIGFNFMELRPGDDPNQLIESFIGMLYQLFDPGHTGIIGPRFEQMVRTAMMTAMSVDGMTLVEVVRILTDDEFARQLIPHIKDPIVKRYWTDQFSRRSDWSRDAIDWVVSKFSPWVHNRIVRNIIGQSVSSFSFRECMDDGKIVLVSLAQGILGAHLSTFIGSVLVPRLLLAAFSRADMPPSERRDFCLYVDEAHNYATPTFVDVLSGARKYGLQVVAANQHIHQLPLDVRSAVFGNVATMVAFRCGVQDAAWLSETLQPSAFSPSDFVELPNFRAIARTLMDGAPTPAFTLAVPPPSPVEEDRARRRATILRKQSRHLYGRPRELVEEELAARAQVAAKPTPEHTPASSMAEWLKTREPAQKASDSA